MTLSHGIKLLLFSDTCIVESIFEIEKYMPWMSPESEVEMLSIIGTDPPIFRWASKIE